MSRTMTVAIVLALVSSGALAETNGTSQGNAPKPSPAMGGPAAPKSTPAVGGPSKGVAPHGSNAAAPASSSTVGGPSTTPKTVTVAPPKPAAGPAASSAKPGTKPGSTTGSTGGTTSPNTAKASASKPSDVQKSQ